MNNTLEIEEGREATEAEFSAGVRAALHEHLAAAAPRDGAERERLTRAFLAGVLAVGREIRMHEETMEHLAAQYATRYRHHAERN